MNLQIESPRLTLYAFHLRNSLDNDVSSDADRLWKQCIALGYPENFSIPELVDLRQYLRCYNRENGHYEPENEGILPPNNLLELLNDSKRFLTLTASKREGRPPLTCIFYPLRLHDTYAVDLTLRYGKIQVELDQLSHLNPNGLLLPNKINASIGQTLLFSASPLSALQDSGTLADECVKALFKESDRPIPFRIASGHLFGSPIFEYDRESPLSGQNNIAEKCHLLVWINTHSETAAKADSPEVYRNFINLLCCRSKILNSYYQARECYYRARDVYSILDKDCKKLDSLPENPDERLQTLKQLLPNLPKQAFHYNSFLSAIQDHLITINTNSKNYKVLLAWLSKQSFPSDNLNFLHLDETWQHFQEQIQVDLSYLNSGLELFDYAIATIRGMVEIDQAARDRAFQETLEVWGVGLATTAIAATAISPFVETSLKTETLKNKTEPMPIVEGGINFLFTLFLSIIVGMLAKWAAEIWVRSRNDRGKRINPRKSG